MLGAPFVERLSESRAPSAALATITAAAVGVILNLAVWFCVHTLFGRVREVPPAGGTFEVPVLTTLNPAALVLAAATGVAFFRFKVGVIPVPLACGAAGVAHRFAAG